MILTQEQGNALDLIAVEVVEFVEHCIQEEKTLEGLEQDRLPFSILLKCLCDEINSQNDHYRDYLSVIAVNVIRGYEKQ